MQQRTAEVPIGWPNTVAASDGTPGRTYSGFATFQQPTTTSYRSLRAEFCGGPRLGNECAPEFN